MIQSNRFKRIQYPFASRGCLDSAGPPPEAGWEPSLRRQTLWSLLYAILMNGASPFHPFTEPAIT